MSDIPYSAPKPLPETHGEAALLLVESLIHGLCAKGLLSSSEALEIVQIALDAQLEIALDRGDNPHNPTLVIRLLKNIVATFAIDAR